MFYAQRFLASHRMTKSPTATKIAGRIQAEQHRSALQQVARPQAVMRRYELPNGGIEAAGAFPGVGIALSHSGDTCVGLQGSTVVVSGSTFGATRDWISNAAESAVRTSARHLSTTLATFCKSSSAVPTMVRTACSVLGFFFWAGDRACDSRSWDRVRLSVVSAFSSGSSASKSAV